MNNTYRSTVLTFGVFDGVHIAHQKVIKLVVSRARERDLESVVLSFDPHPALSVTGEAPPSLTTVAMKVELLKKLGIDRVVVEDFNEEFSKLSPVEFVRDVLVGRFKVKEAVVGYDCAFGKGRSGNKQILKELGDRYGFTVDIVEPYMVDGEIVSSTRLRAAIMAGELDLAFRLLGRYYSISGLVVQGKGVGRKIGYATANIISQEQVLPPSGVYAARVCIGDKGIFDGVLNMGLQPTFGKNDFRVEVHLLDFDGDLYNQNLEVFFLRKVRDERIFASPEELAGQIRKDEEVARKILKEY